MFEVENYEHLHLNTRIVWHCTKEEPIFTTSQHMLIFSAKKSSAGLVGGWVDGWMDVKAGLRFVYSNQNFQTNS